jgi:hypothetical protein
MSKIISWLTGGLIKEVGSVIDSLTTTKEEKLEIKKQRLTHKWKLLQDGSQT